MDRLRQFFDRELFELAGTPVSVGTLAAVFGIVVATFLLSRGLQKATESFLKARSDSTRDEGTISAFRRLIHYAVLCAGLGVALHTLGVELSGLFAAGAVFAVAIGFAMQNITQNFVSGLILLGERTLKPGDVIEVDGQFVRITDMGIRVTVARTLNDEDLIIPNSQLAQSTVKNFTFRDQLLRLRVAVGVSYESDLAQVREVLQTASHALEWRHQAKDPVVLLTDFGASSVDFEVSVWIEDPWHSRHSRSNLREAIWFALEEHHITIAYPQLDVHVDDQLVKALAPTEAGG